MKTDSKSQNESVVSAKMEFYINHTRQEIARLPTDEWEGDDDIDREFVHLDVEEEFFMMVHLIDRYNYYIDPEDRDIFMCNIDAERRMAEEYERILEEEKNNMSQTTDSWMGWDEPGASFDC